MKPKVFIQNLSKCLFEEFDQDIEEDQLEKSFKEAIKNLPNGQLRNVLETKFSHYLQKLQKRLQILGKRQLPSINKGVDDSLEELSSELDDRKEVADDSPKPAHNMLYNLMEKTEINKPKKKEMKKHSNEQRCQTYQMFMKEALETPNIAESLITEVIQDFKDSCHIDQETADGKKQFDWLPVCNFLLDLTTNSQPEAYIIVLKTLYESIEKDVNKCLSKQKIVRAGRLIDILKRFIISCYQGMKKYDLHSSLARSFSRYASALLSYYVDLCALYSRKIDTKKKYGRDIAGFVSYILQPWPESMIEVALCLSALTEDNYTVMFPFLRKCSELKPCGASNSHYLKYVLMVKHIAEAYSGYDDIEQIIMGTKIIAAPKGFIDWLKDECAEAMDYIPWEDKKFKKQKITIFLLEEADEDLISILLDSFCSDREGDLHQTNNENILDVNGDMATEQLFYLDTAGGAGDMATEQLFYLDTAGGAEAPEVTEAETSTDAKKSKHTPIILKTMEEVERLVNESNKRDSDSIQTYRLDPEFLSKSVKDPEDRKFLQSEIVSITSVSSLSQVGDKTMNIKELYGDEEEYDKENDEEEPVDNNDEDGEEEQVDEEEEEDGEEESVVDDKDEEEDGEEEPVVNDKDEEEDSEEEPDVDDKEEEEDSEEEQVDDDKEEEEENDEEEQVDDDSDGEEENIATLNLNVHETIDVDNEDENDKCSTSLKGEQSKIPSKSISENKKLTTSTPYNIEHQKRKKASKTEVNLALHKVLSETEESALSELDDTCDFGESVDSFSPSEDDHKMKSVVNKVGPKDTKTSTLSRSLAKNQQELMEKKCSPQKKNSCKSEDITDSENEVTVIEKKQEVKMSEMHAESESDEDMVGKTPEKKGNEKTGKISSIEQKFIVKAIKGKKTPKKVKEQRKHQEEGELGSESVFTDDTEGTSDHENEVKPNTRSQSTEEIMGIIKDVNQKINKHAKTRKSTSIDQQNESMFTDESVESTETQSVMESEGSPEKNMNGSASKQTDCNINVEDAGKDRKSSSKGMQRRTPRKNESEGTETEEESGDTEKSSSIKKHSSLDLNEHKKDEHVHRKGSSEKKTPKKVESVDEETDKNKLGSVSKGLRTPRKYESLPLEIENDKLGKLLDDETPEKNKSKKEAMKRKSSENEHKTKENDEAHISEGRQRKHSKEELKRTPKKLMSDEIQKEETPEKKNSKKDDTKRKKSGNEHNANENDEAHINEGRQRKHSKDELKRTPKNLMSDEIENQETETPEKKKSKEVTRRKSSGNEHNAEENVEENSDEGRQWKHSKDELKRTPKKLMLDEIQNQDTSGRSSEKEMINAQQIKGNGNRKSSTEDMKKTPKKVESVDEETDKNKSGSVSKGQRRTPRKYESLPREIENDKPGKLLDDQTPEKNKSKKEATKRKSSENEHKTKENDEPHIGEGRQRKRSKDELKRTPKKLMSDEMQKEETPEKNNSKKDDMKRKKSGNEHNANENDEAHINEGRQRKHSKDELKTTPKKFVSDEIQKQETETPEKKKSKEDTRRKSSGNEHNAEENVEANSNEGRQRKQSKDELKRTPKKLMSGEIQNQDTSGSSKKETINAQQIKGNGNRKSSTEDMKKSPKKSVSDLSEINKLTPDKIHENINTDGKTDTLSDTFTKSPEESHNVSGLSDKMEKFPVIKSNQITPGKSMKHPLTEVILLDTDSESEIEVVGKRRAAKILSETESPLSPKDSKDNEEMLSPIITMAQSDDGDVFKSPTSVKSSTSNTSPVKSPALTLPAIEKSLKSPALEKSLKSPASEKSLKSSASEKSLKSPASEKSLKSPASEKSLKSPASEKSLKSPASEKSLKSPASEKSLKSSTSEKSLKSPASEKSLKSPASEKSLKSPASEKSLKSPASEKSLKSPASEKSLKSPASEKSLKSPASEKSLKSSTSEKSLKSPASEKSLKSPASEKSLKSPASEKSLKSPASEKSLKSPASEKSLKSSTSEKALSPVKSPKKSPVRSPDLVKTPVATEKSISELKSSSTRTAGKGKETTRKEEHLSPKVKTRTLQSRQKAEKNNESDSDIEIIPSSLKKIYKKADDETGDESVPELPDLAAYLKQDDSKNKEGKRKSAKGIAEIEVSPRKTSEGDNQAKNETTPPRKSKRRSIATGVDKLDTEIDGPSRTKRTRSATKSKQSDHEVAGPSIPKTTRGRASFAKTVESDSDASAAELDKKITAGRTRKTSQTKAHESENENKSESDFETTTARPSRRSVGGCRLASLKEVITESTQDESDIVPATPPNKSTRQRKGSATTSKKEIKKIEQLRVTRKRRLSGEMADSMSIGSCSTDSEVTFPNIKKKTEVIVKKKESVKKEEPVKKNAKRVSAPVVATEPEKSPEKSAGRRYSLRKK